MLINRAIKSNNNLGPTPAKSQDPEPSAETLTHPTPSALGVLWRDQHVWLALLTDLYQQVPSFSQIAPGSSAESNKGVNTNILAFLVL